MKSRANIDGITDPVQQSDQDLVAGCLKGDASAWEALIIRYQRLIYSIPIKIGLSPNDAADVFQAVCLKLLESIPTLRNQEKISAWLTVTTARHCWRVALLKRREHIAVPYGSQDESNETLDVAAADPPLDEQQAALERQQILRAAVDALPDRCRELITLLFYSEADLSYDEMARRLGIPRTSMGPTRARCLAKLKKLLEGKI